MPPSLKALIIMFIDGAVGYTVISNKQQDIQLDPNSYGRIAASMHARKATEVGSPARRVPDQGPLW